jgi:UDP-glucose 4-epimerase
VLEAARDLGCTPVVYASSAAVYGDVGSLAAREDLPPRPQTAYGADKLGSELHAHIAERVHKVPTLGLRFFNVYGPRQDPNSPYSGVISIFARRVVAREQIIIHGTGEQTRDFIFVGDVVRYLAAGMAMLERERGSMVLNVCTGHGTSVRALVRTLGELEDYEPAVIFGPARVGDILHSVGDPSAAWAALRLRAEVPLREGLALTCQHLLGQVAPSMRMRSSAVAVPLEPWPRGHAI